MERVQEIMERGWKHNSEMSSPNCPRCGSCNTKFCYYNNYSLTQPRYFCKACRRYWTKGGSLRNVPVGGGCRKTRRHAGKTLRVLHSSSAFPAPNNNIAAHNNYHAHPSTNNVSDYNNHSPHIDLEYCPKLISITGDLAATITEDVFVWRGTLDGWLAAVGSTLTLTGKAALDAP